MSSYLHPRSTRQDDSKQEPVEDEVEQQQQHHHQQQQRKEPLRPALSKRSRVIASLSMSQVQPPSLPARSTHSRAPTMPSRSNQQQQQLRRAPPGERASTMLSAQMLGASTTLQEISDPASIEDPYQAAALRQFDSFADEGFFNPDGSLPTESNHHGGRHRHRPDPPLHYQSNYEFTKDAVITVYQPPESGNSKEDMSETLGSSEYNVVPQPLGFAEGTDGDDVEAPSASFQPFILPKPPAANPKTQKKNDRAYQLRNAWKKLLRHKTLKAIQLILCIYVALYTFYGGLYDFETGTVVDKESPERTSRGVLLSNGTERAIVATNTFQIYLIAAARLFAWWMYPCLVLVFLTKFRATTAFLEKTPLSMFFQGDLHELHLYCGWTIMICSLLHAFSHLLRWGLQGNLYLVFHHFSGLTGYLILTSMLFICIPMTYLRTRMNFETRKLLHYFFLLFAFALCFHTPRSAIPNGGFSSIVFGTVLAWYFLDAAYCNFFMTEKIETTRFEVLPGGTQMTMKVSDFFQKNGAQGGYCYVCLPWVDKTQWHAFSLFEDPANPEDRQIFVQKGGDWTSNVHRLLQRDTVRPAWVQGPFPSPYNSAEEYDNQILVASGIGITPALSVIRAHKDSRRINLIWAVRDRHLLEFFLRHLYLDHSGWNLIFYTGKEELQNTEIFTNTNVCIILGRPKLSELIPNIIYGIESGQGLPEAYIPEVKQGAATEIAESLTQFQRRSVERLESRIISDAAQKHGFEIRDNSAVRAEMEQSTDRLSIEGAILNQLDFSFKPWESHPSAKPFVKTISDEHIQTWGMLYCGGAKVLQTELNKISYKYGIDLHIESFGW